MFFNYVLFTDEATFHKNGSVNRHNFHYYFTENPHFLRQIDDQHRWSVNVWAGIVGGNIIGPFFFNGHLNGQIYLQFLQNELPRLLADLPVNIRNRMWFQQDGAPAHFSRNVTDHLNENFGEEWIGRNGPVIWPPRSPDLTKLDFFLWGFTKDTVYKDSPTTAIDMEQRIRNAFNQITPQMLQEVNRSQERINLCLEQNARHFEHLI